MRQNGVDLKTETQGHVGAFFLGEVELGNKVEVRFTRKMSEIYGDGVAKH